MRLMPCACWVVATAFLLAAGLPSHASADTLAPGAPSVLVINQASPHWPAVSSRRGPQIEMLLRHFTPNTVRISDAEYGAGELFEFDRVVVVGNDALTPLPPVLVNDLARAGRPVLWLGYGLHQLPLDMDTAFGFSPGYSIEDRPTWVEYRGQRYQGSPGHYGLTRIAISSAQVLATYIGAQESVPYVTRGGDFWYVNGLPSIDSDYPDPETDVPTLIFADVLHDFFGTAITAAPQAVIRLEDVSVHIDPARLIETADYLSSQQVPFAIGLIPAQRFEDGRVVWLHERPEFVRALRHAQNRGATIVLHGYHHTFGSGEDFEFWDPERDAPIAGEHWDMYAFKVEHGIRILRDLGLEPRLWETPHYTASPLAYQVFSRYFSHAIENREPVTWLPYPAGPDEFGQMLIPETIGYINPAEGWTVAAQLRRARLLRIVRDGWAVGFYHPASMPLSELRALVSGLRRMGYEFADLRTLSVEVRYSYEPSLRTRLGTWLGVTLGMSTAQLDRWLERQANWWPAARGIPWSLVLIIGLAGIFLIRLREQWQPAPVEERSIVETAPAAAEPGQWRQLRPVLVAAIGAVVLTGGLWAARQSGWRSPIASGEQAQRGTVSQEPAVPVEADVPALWPMPEGAPEAPRVASTQAQSESSSDWLLTIYYTAVESYFSGPPQEVRGCPVLECANGSDLLGTYPSDFVEAVYGAGTGRITTGPHAGKYLNWSINTGYWLDTAPRDARGFALQPYVSAAADLTVPYGTRFRILDCGVTVHDGTPLDPTICAQLSAAHWVVVDRFTVGTVGKHVDLFIGEQDQADFLNTSPKAISAVRATLSMPAPAGQN